MTATAQTLQAAGRGRGVVSAPCTIDPQHDPPIPKERRS